MTDTPGVFKKLTESCDLRCEEICCGCCDAAEAERRDARAKADTQAAKIKMLTEDRDEWREIGRAVWDHD